MEVLTLAILIRKSFDLGGRKKSRSDLLAYYTRTLESFCQLNHRFDPGDADHNVMRNVRHTYPHWEIVPSTSHTSFASPWVVFGKTRCPFWNLYRSKTAALK